MFKKTVFIIMATLIATYAIAGTLKRESNYDEGRSAFFRCDSQLFSISDMGDNMMNVVGLGSCDKIISNTDVYSAAATACSCYSN